MRVIVCVLVFGGFAIISSYLSFAEETAQSPPPPAGFTARDIPNDNGSGIEIAWEIPPEDDPAASLITGYEIYRAESIDGPYQLAGLSAPGTTYFKDAVKSNGQQESDEGEHAKEPGLSQEETGMSSVERNKPYYYKAASVSSGGLKSYTEPVGPVKAKVQLFHSGKTPVMVLTLVFFLLVIYYIQAARRRGASMYIRPIAGMNEIDNAIGRATEMGRPILYVLGLGAPEEIATIASYTILARVAKKTAEYRTSLLVPCNEPIVMTIAQETVRNAYLEAGHPDAYSDDMVYFVTSMQFAYVAAVNGLMLREKTATNCYFGKFYAESLLLSEAGNIAGSIQVAGTDEVAQLPFFVTTCDYTLIGEELYAASAYLGRDPLLLGALKAQDFAKAAVMVFILIGALLISFNIDWVLKLISVNM